MDFFTKMNEALELNKNCLKPQELDILFLILAFSFLLSQCDTESDQDDKVRFFILG